MPGGDAPPPPPPAGGPNGGDVDLQAIEGIPRDTLVALLRRKDKEAKATAAKLEKLEERYVKVVRFLAGIIRREQPDAVIYGPGTAMLQCLDEYPYPWIPRALEAGLAEEIDVFSYHPYRAPAWRHNIPENASQFQHLLLWVV